MHRRENYERDTRPIHTEKGHRRACAAKSEEDERDEGGDGKFRSKKSHVARDAIYERRHTVCRHFARVRSNFRTYEILDLDFISQLWIFAALI